MRQSAAVLEAPPIDAELREPSGADSVPVVLSLSDAVAVAVLAMNQLAPATLRTATLGKAVKVVVSDPRLGAVFRAALERTQETRRTDRLIEIVVERAAHSR